MTNMPGSDPSVHQEIFTLMLANPCRCVHRRVCVGHVVSATLGLPWLTEHVPSLPTLLKL